MFSSFTVRPVDQNEWQAFSEIRLEALRECPGMFSSNFAFESAYDKKNWQAWLTPETRRIFGLYDAGNIVGTTGIITRALDSTGKTGMIIAVYIRPAYRAKGFSSALYQAAITWGLGYLAWDKIVVAHRADNEASKKTIQRQNFRFTHAEPRVWPDGTASDEVWYQLDLEPLRKAKS